MTGSPRASSSTASKGRSESNFGGRRIKDYIRQEYRNQHDELVATFICSRMRFERGEMQKRARARADRGAASVDRGASSRRSTRMSSRNAAGATPRYWEDVEVGDEIDIITKGPIGLTDEIAFVAVGRGPDPAAGGAQGVAQALSEASALGVPRSGRRTRWSRSIRCTTTTTPRNCRARRWPTTSASSARAGRSTR